MCVLQGDDEPACTCDGDQIEEGSSSSRDRQAVHHDAITRPQVTALVQPRPAGSLVVAMGQGDLDWPRRKRREAVDGGGGLV